MSVELAFIFISKYVQICDCHEPLPVSIAGMGELGWAGAQGGARGYPPPGPGYRHPHPYEHQKMHQYPQQQVNKRNASMFTKITLKQQLCDIITIRGMQTIHDALE